MRDSFEALILPRLDVGVEPVFHHVFSPLLAELLGDGRPLRAQLLDQFEEQDVFVDGPGGVAETGVQIVGPLLPALLQCAVVPTFGKVEELVGVILPL